MCTVVTRHGTGGPLRILAVRDEFVSRAFDDPGAWWPHQPDVIGGRDRLAGGTWCATDVRTGATALLVNRIERREGTPSRGVLPLAALAHGARWNEAVDHRTMASFNLVLATPSGVTVWEWDAADLRRIDLSPGTHVVTSRGVDAEDDKTQQYAPRFRGEDWLDVVTSSEPVPDVSSILVRVPFDDDVYATVFGQLITARPGNVQVSYSRTPWRAGTWRELGVPSA